MSTVEHIGAYLYDKLSTARAWDPHCERAGYERPNWPLRIDWSHNFQNDTGNLVPVRNSP